MSDGRRRREGFLAWGLRDELGGARDEKEEDGGGGGEGLVPEGMKGLGFNRVQGER